MPTEGASLDKATWSRSVNEVSTLKIELDSHCTTLLDVLRIKSSLTYQHSCRVSSCAEELAVLAGLDQNDVALVAAAALLHDIGKIAIPESILTKAKNLTREEYALIQGHCRIGESLLSQTPSFGRVARAVRLHHENWDGGGYPDHLRGEEIPLVSRIILLADSIDAMRFPRSYKQAYPWQRIVAEILRCRAGQFDPDLADLAIAWIHGETKQRLAQAA
jgi:putative nucleotidyltransferase with HDIG domain